MSKVPGLLRNSLAALALLTGVGGGAYIVDEAVTRETLGNEYIHAVAADPNVSNAVRIAMVMAHYYESSNRHIGRPYVDRNGKGQPWTVCNGLTSAVVQIDPVRYYTPADCYRLEKAVYLRYVGTARQLLTHWDRYGPYQQAVFLDFIHNKGEWNFATSTMLRKANAGDLLGACRENPRWNRGTVNGVSKVLPGLQVRGDANAEICLSWS